MVMGLHIGRRFIELLLVNRRHALNSTKALEISGGEVDFIEAGLLVVAAFFDSTPISTRRCFG